MRFLGSWLPIFRRSANFVFNFFFKKVIEENKKKVKPIDLPTWRPAGIKLDVGYGLYLIKASHRFHKNLPFVSWFWCDDPPEAVLFKLKCGRLKVVLLSSEPTSVAKRQLVRTPQAKSLVHNMLSPSDLMRIHQMRSSQPWVNKVTKDFSHFHHHSKQLLKGHCWGKNSLFITHVCSMHHWYTYSNHIIFHFSVLKDWLIFYLLSIHDLAWHFKLRFNVSLIFGL